MAGRVKDIDGILMPTKPFVGLAKGEGRFRTLLSVLSNFANLILYTEVMQRDVYVGVLYPGNLLLLFLRCSDAGVL